MRDVIYVGGAWADSSDPATIDVINPANEEVIDRVPAGTPADVDRAVAEARRALPGWEATPPAERARHLRAVLDGITARQDHLATLIATDLGAPYQLALKVHVGTPIAVLTGVLEVLEGYDFDGERVGNSMVVREPVGVVGAITPVELPAAPGRREGRARARRRLHRRAEAERGRAARGVRARRHHRRGRPAARGVQPRVGARAGRR